MEFIIQVIKRNVNQITCIEFLMIFDLWFREDGYKQCTVHLNIEWRIAILIKDCQDELVMRPSRYPGQEHHQLVCHFTFAQTKDELLLKLFPWTWGRQILRSFCSFWSDLRGMLDTDATGWIYLLAGACQCLQWIVGVSVSPCIYCAWPLVLDLMSRSIHIVTELILHNDWVLVQTICL